jgi:hypothetical protein
MGVCVRAGILRMIPPVISPSRIDLFVRLSLIALSLLCIYGLRPVCAAAAPEAYGRPDGRNVYPENLRCAHAQSC